MKHTTPMSHDTPAAGPAEPGVAPVPGVPGAPVATPAPAEPDPHGHKHWRDLGPVEKAVAVGLGATQVALALVAWGDLAMRPRELVRGRKAVWAVVIAVNYVGPVAYLWRGRRFPHIP